MKLIIIAAIGKNSELGKNNDLIWKIREDLKFFKEMTMDHYILMGKNTFLSLPGLLKGRKHLVISTTMSETSSVKIYKNINEFLSDESLKNEEVFVIGGASIFKELIDYTDEMLLTEIDSEADADVYFPKFDKNAWLDETLGKFEINDLTYKRVKYIRNRKN